MCHLALILASSLALWQEAADRPQRATIVVRAPGAAKLFIDDISFAQRTVVTPPLEPGYIYHYTMRMELARDGQVFRSSRKVPVRAGTTTTVDFGDPSPAKVELSPGKPAVKLPAQATPAADFQLSREEQQLLDLTNKERADAGLAPLRPNRKLFQAAREHSANMARQEKLDHTLDEKGPSERIREAGYQGYNWGENIAYGMPTPAGAIQVWMNSEGHRGNILNSDYTEIGLGIVATDRGVRYYTQVFGRHFGR